MGVYLAWASDLKDDLVTLVSPAEPDFQAACQPLREALTYHDPKDWVDPNIDAIDLLTRINIDKLRAIRDQLSLDHY